MKKVKKCILVTAIIKIKCVLKILNSESEFELNLAWRLLMSQKRKTLIRIYEDELNTLFRRFGSDLTRIPLPVYQHAFIAPVTYTNQNRLEVHIV